jgi:hypothetical protein
MPYALHAGPPTGCDSPSSVASGRNRENSAPLRARISSKDEVLEKSGE